MKSFVLYLFAFLHAASLCAQQTNSKPNVILIVTDDQGWGDLGIHGNKNLSTPNIDLLAKEGARFSHFFVSPVCSPTRAEMLTGRYHPRGGVYNTSAGGERLDLDESTLAQAFKSAGYVTAAYGKWHNGMQYPYHPNARGFDDFYGFCSGHWANYFSPQLEHNGEPVKGNGFITDDLTERAMKYMEGNREKPFFLYVPYNTPHSPMQVPDEWWKKFKDRKPGMLSGSANEDPEFTKAALALCENIDWNVGRLMNKVKELNLDGNTIVLYLSDNGPNSVRWNAGMKGIKGSTDEGGVRSPLFIRWPGRIAGGKQIPQIAAAIDLFPTLLDLANIDFAPNKPFDGISLKPLLLEMKPVWTDRSIFNHWNGRTSVRTQQYRLDANGLLFNMQDDPGQQKHVTNEQFVISETLKKSVEKWRSEVLSELPEIDKRPFTFGHPDSRYTQLPARDAQPHGNIKRSTRYPNASYFTNWLTADDRLTWEIDAVAEGNFEVVLYYTCPLKDAGATLELSFGETKLVGQIAEGHDPPLEGMHQDRVTRIESYDKDFKPMTLGTMYFKKGAGQLTLKALAVPGQQVMDFRLLTFRRVDP